MANHWAADGEIVHHMNTLCQQRSSSHEIFIAPRMGSGYNGNENAPQVGKTSGRDRMQVGEIQCGYEYRVSLVNSTLIHIGGDPVQFRCRLSRRRGKRKPYRAA